MTDENFVVIGGLRVVPSVSLGYEQEIGIGRTLLLTVVNLDRSLPIQTSPPEMQPIRLRFLVAKAG